MADKKEKPTHIVVKENVYLKNEETGQMEAVPLNKPVALTEKQKARLESKNMVRRIDDESGESFNAKTGIVGELQDKCAQLQAQVEALTKERDTAIDERDAAQAIINASGKK